VPNQIADLLFVQFHFLTQ